MSGYEDQVGAPFARAGGRGRRGCRIRRRGDRMFAYDPISGDEVAVVGVDGGEDGELLGADEDEIMGALDADEDVLGGEEGDDDELSDAEDEGDELLGAAWTEGDQSFGGRVDRLERRLDKLQDRVQKLRDKIADMRGPFKKLRRKKLQKRIDRITRRMTKIRAKIQKARAERQKAVSAANKSLAAAGLIAGGAAAGAGAGAMMAAAGMPGAPPSREAVQGAAPVDLLDPAKAQAIRNAQAGGGMRFGVQSPPGSGRLMSLPMYASGSTSPRQVFTVPVGGTATAVTVFTETTSYAVVRIVGFRTSLRGTGIDATTAVGGIGTVEDFKIAGSPNLFLHENAANAAEYQTDLDKCVGLRNYPILRSPNQAQVTLGAQGDQNDVVVLSGMTVVDMIVDDIYGAGLQGPYSG